MQKLIFQTDIGNEFLKTLNERVDEMLLLRGQTRRANALMFWKIGLCFAAVGAGFYGLLGSRTVGAFYFFYLLTAAACILTALNIAHDAAHGAIFHEKKKDAWLFSLSFNLIGSSSYIWGRDHTGGHHDLPNVKGYDPCVINSPLVRIAPQQPRRWFHRFQHIYIAVPYLIYTLEYFFISEPLLLLGLNQHRDAQFDIPKTEVAKAFFYKLLYIAALILMPIFYLKMPVAHVLIAFVLGQMLLSLVLILFLGISHLAEGVEHPAPNGAGEMPMSWPLLQLRTTADYDLDMGWGYWFFGGFNAHALHHLLPNVCHIHFRAIVPILKRTIREYDLPYLEMPFWKLLAAHFRHLKMMGQPNN